MSLEAEQLVDGVFPWGWDGSSSRSSSSSVLKVSAGPLGCFDDTRQCHIRSMTGRLSLSLSYLLCVAPRESELPSLMDQNGKRKREEEKKRRKVGGEFSFSQHLQGSEKKTGAHRSSVRTSVCAWDWSPFLLT